MAKFIPWLEVTTDGIQEVGSSPYGTVSILAQGVTGTVGLISNDVFIPHADGAISDGAMLTFECGKGRRVAVETTGTGSISTAQV